MFRLPPHLEPAPAGAGARLPAEIQARMEDFFRTGLSDVRIHLGPQAPALGAQAFTAGSRIYFGPGQYHPHAPFGLRVLAHELVHVLQQRAGRVRNPFGAGTALVHDPHLEAEADRLAAQAAARPAGNGATAPGRGVDTRRARHRHQPPRTIQRLVLRLSDDELSEGTYRALTELPEGHIDPTGSLRPINPDLGGAPLAQLGANESLHVVIHGDGKGKVEGMTPSQFLDRLVSLGLDRTQHRGTIRLISCFSGTLTAREHIFAEDFAWYLRDRGFSNAVIGFNGLVRARTGAKVDVIPPEKEQAFEMLRNVLFTLHEQQARVAFNPPNADPSTQEWKSWKAEFDRLQGVIKTRRDEAEALWKPQAIGTNIVHIPAQTT